MTRVQDGVTAGDEDLIQESGQDADELEAERAIARAYSDVREREKGAFGVYEMSRYQGYPRRDSDGRLLRDEVGQLVYGPMELFFQRPDKEARKALEKKHTHAKPIRRRGQLQYEDELDADGYAFGLIYLCLMPWCRTLYFDNPKLWGDDPVGTGEEFLATRLNTGEMAGCAEVIADLDGLGDERAEALGKL